MSTIEEYQAWQAASPGRTVKIDIRQDYSGNNGTTIWVYDARIVSGQEVKSVEEIDLVAEKERCDRRTFERLSKQFGEAV